LFYIYTRLVNGIMDMTVDAPPAADGILFPPVPRAVPPSPFRSRANLREDNARNEPGPSGPV